MAIAVTATEVEQLAALKLIEKRAAVLEMPFLNTVWLDLLDKNLAHISKRGPLFHNGKHRTCAHVAITSAGLRVLSKAKA